MNRPTPLLLRGRGCFLQPYYSHPKKIFLLHRFFSTSSSYQQQQNTTVPPAAPVLTRNGEPISPSAEFLYRLRKHGVNTYPNFRKQLYKFYTGPTQASSITPEILKQIKEATVKARAGKKPRADAPGGVGDVNGMVKEAMELLEGDEILGERKHVEEVVRTLVEYGCTKWIRKEVEVTGVE